ncbi:MAG TPA: hypothetical protein PLD20_28140 [Blastocatellia bacterium]|nr:hypothetical protein [Blastocatellia bacterium]HMY72440.1 hypothetical protein [Blastocatellia bacterium]HMZ21835.1 hypothetical protein [Blastocatellia bacterium]HNG30014.1 hypothetical protein [Blastocatellia bacterium]
MSKEKAKAKDSLEAKEQRKKILLGVLLLAMVVVFYFQFFSDGDSPVTTNNPTASSSPIRKASPSPTPAALRPGQKPERIITEPLVLAWFSTRTPGDGTGRNIFVYPTPTPEPPPKPVPAGPTPTPLPILLSQVQPTGVLGRTGDFTMTVYGDKFPSDAQGFLEGRPYETKVLSQTELRVQVPGEAIMRAGTLGVQVRSKGDANLYSNQLSISVAEPPPPSYRFIGLYSNKNGFLAVLKSQSDETDVFNVKKGDKFGGHWLVLRINAQEIEVQDLNIPSAKITHIIKFTGENG